LEIPRFNGDAVNLADSRKDEEQTDPGSKAPLHACSLANELPAFD
jgi:hypothetical protein